MIYERIEKALNSAIKLHNSGTNANDSIIKVAREHELNPETINRVIEAFNTAKTKAYVKVAKDKSADFDIADKKTVINSVFNEAQIPANSVVSEMKEDLNDFLATEEVSKTASEEEFDIASTSSIPLESRIKTAFFAINEQNRDLSEKRDLIIDSREAFYKGMKEASEILEFTEEREKVADYAAQIFYEYQDNKPAGRILGLIAKVAKITIDDLSENLSGDVNYDDNKFLRCFSGLVDSESMYTNSVTGFNSLVRDCSAKEAELRNLICDASGINKEASASNYLWSPGRGNIAATQKFAEFPEDLISDFDQIIFGDLKKNEVKLNKSASDLVNNSTKHSSDKKETKKKPTEYPQIFSPGKMVLDQMSNNFKSQLMSSDSAMADTAANGYSLKLRGIDNPKKYQIDKQQIENIKREAILRELMNDDIISQQDPSEIENSYNALIQLAPNASMIKDIARSVLRQGTAQVIDPHFANSLVELENNLLKTKQLGQGQTPQK